MSKPKPKPKPPPRGKPAPPDPRWKDVGALIREDRIAKGIGQAELGRMADLKAANTSMWRYEAGHNAIPLPRLERIAEILGQPVERYLPTVQGDVERPPLTPAEAQEMYGLIARAAVEVTVTRTPEAVEAFNELVADYYHRLRR